MHSPCKGALLYWCQKHFANRTISISGFAPVFSRKYMDQSQSNNTAMGREPKITEFESVSFANNSTT